MPTRFTSSPRDTLARLPVTQQTGLVVTDVRSELSIFNVKELLKRLKNDPNEVINMLMNLRTGTIANLKNSLGGLKDRLLSDLLYEKDSAIAELIDRLSNYVKDRELLQGLTVEELQQLLERMQGSQNGGRYNYFTQGSTNLGNYSPEEYERAQRLVDTLTALNPDAEPEDQFGNVDNVGQDALLGMLIEDAATLGVNQVVIDYLIAINDSIARQSMIKQALQVSFETANLDLINLLLSDSTLDITPAMVVGLIPGWKHSLLRSYKIPVDKTINDYVDLLAELDGTLELLNLGANGGWEYANRAGDSIYDMELFQIASVDARSLFMNSTALRKAQMIADTYPAVDLLNTFKTSYPFVQIPA